MFFKSYYSSPIGRILLLSDGKNLIGSWIENQKYYLSNFSNDIVEKDNIEILVKTKKWLDRYFNKQKPKISELQLSPIGNEFRQCVWKLLLNIPYGETTTYGEISNKVAKIMGKERISPQAIGNAVGNNPISIIIPCHRVVGKSGSLTGYAGGIDKKIQLLELEGVNMEKLYVPKNKF